MKKIGFNLLIVCSLVFVAQTCFAAPVPSQTPPKPILTAPLPTPPIAQTKPIEKTKKYGIEAGFGGGAGILGVSYSMPLKPNTDIKLDLGYGVGTNYSLMLLQAQGIMKNDNQLFAALSLDLVSYSTAVQDIPGHSGIINSGATLGIGIAVGKDFGLYSAQVGYSTILGLTAGVSYKL